MQYIGSKNKISKDLVPIIQSYITADTKGYLEPFVGGANMIDKIQHHNKIGCDIHKELIALLTKTSKGTSEFPEVITLEEYTAVKNNKSNYDDWYVGLVGFCATFGNKYFGGYARNSKGDNSGKRCRSAIINLKKQSENIQGVKFINCSFLDLSKDEIKGYVIYCDPPYRGTTKYKTEKFPYEDFYKWVKEMSIHNTVLISEYNMPEEFTCIWEKELKTTLGSGVNKDSEKSRIERLYTYKSN